MKIVSKHGLTQGNRAAPTLQTSPYHWVLCLSSCHLAGCWQFYSKLFHLDINLDVLLGSLTFENATNTQMTYGFTELCT